jgi:hypothetical protein
MGFHAWGDIRPPAADVAQRNYAPYNFLTIFSDGFIAVWLLVLLYLYYREGGFRKQDQVSGQQRQTPKESG